MKERDKKAYSLLSNYQFIYSNMWKYDKSLILYGIGEVILGVLMPLGAVILPAVVVKLLERKDSTTEYIRLMAAVFLVYAVIAMIHAFLTARNRYQYIDVRLNLFSFILFRKSLNIDYYQCEREKIREDLKKAGDSVYTNQRGIEGFMHQNVNLLTNILGLVTYSAIIGRVNPVMLVLLLMLSAVQMLAFHRAKLFEHNKKDEMAKIEVTQGYLHEQSFDVRAGKDIRIYQLDRLMGRVYGIANSRMRKLKSKVRRAYYGNDVVEILLKFFRDAICYGYLLYLLWKGLPVSDFVLYIGIIGGVADWIMKITRDAAELGRSDLMICDFREYCELKNVFRHEGGKDTVTEDSALDIVFEHVSYQYEGSSEYVLKDVSFHMAKGDKFALVGINGAGKTTIVKLMCGFYYPTEGRILINGTDMRELNIENYFKQIAVIFQDANVLSFTIGENITGTVKESMDREKLTRVIELSGLKNKIDGLTKGADTYMNKDMEESGVQLSGGELQKLLLARALYKEAKLLLLDEPTAAMDAIAESELYEKYGTLLKGRTSLFISHRLASTRFCSQILYLEKGEVIEKGTHDTLMELGGRYAKMFQVQSRYYKEEDEIGDGTGDTSMEFCTAAVSGMGGKYEV